MLRAVVDTNIFLAALWSRNGAAFEIFAQLRLGKWQLVLSNHLLFEYEEVGKRNAAEMNMSVEDINAVLDALCVSAEQCQLEPDWIPRLNDPDDEPLLQLSVEGRVPIIVTRNLRHLKAAREFGIEVLAPAEFLSRIRV